MATPTRRPAMTHADAGRWVLLLHLVLSPLLFCTWTADVFEGPKAALLTAAALVLAGLAASAWVARLGVPCFRASSGPWRFIKSLDEARKHATPRDLATLGLLALVGSAAVSTLFSVSPLTSLRGAPDSHAGLLTLVSYLVLYLSTRGLCRTPEEGRRLLTAAVVGSALSSAYALLQATRLDPAAWDGAAAFAGGDRPFGTLGHANYLSAYLVMAAPLVALFLLRAAERRRWGAALALTLVCLSAGAAVVAALSRAAWLAGGVAVLVLGCGWFLAGARRAALILAGLGLAGLFAGFCWWTTAATPGDGLAGRVLERLSRLDDGEGRRQIWRASWELFRDRPLLGWGPDTFQIAFGRHRPPDYANVEWDITPTRAHNVALHVLATQGAVGGTAAALFALGLALAGARAWRRSSPADRPTVVAVAAGVAAFLTQDLFGFTVVGCGALFVTGAALLSRWAEPTAEAEPAGLARRASAWAVAPHIGIGLATVAAVYFVVGRPIQAQVACGAGDRLLSAAPAEALARYERAAALDPYDDRVWTKVSAAAQLASRQAPGPEGRRLLGRAREALERARALTPAAPYHHANLGRLLGEMAAAALARPDDAVAEWDAALSADPLNSTFLAEAARTALVVGRRDRARAWAARGLELYPGYALLHVQQGNCDFVDGRLDEAAAELDRSFRADWHGAEDDLTHAQAMLAAVQLARGEFDCARQLAAEACRRDPGWATACLLQARALRALGRRDEAIDQYRRLLTLDPANAEAKAAIGPKK